MNKDLQKIINSIKDKSPDYQLGYFIGTIDFHLRHSPTLTLAEIVKAEARRLSENK